MSLEPDCLTNKHKVFFALFCVYWILMEINYHVYWGRIFLCFSWNRNCLLFTVLENLITNSYTVHDICITNISPLCQEGRVSTFIMDIFSYYKVILFYFFILKLGFILIFKICMCVGRRGGSSFRLLKLPQFGAILSKLSGKLWIQY